MAKTDLQRLTGISDLFSPEEIEGVASYAKNTLKDVWGGMDTLDRAALATAPIPIAGDVVGAVNDVRYLAEDPSLANAGLAGLGLLPFVPSLGMVKAYHGTPHKVDKFDMGKIGTGEGAQAYGHGLYFAENPEVAGQYQKALSRTNPTAQKHLDLWQGDRKKALAAYDDYIRDGSLGDPAKWSEDTRARVQDTRNQIESEPGNLYDVNIDVNHEDLLDWDAPLSEQPEKVQKALAGVNVNPEQWTPDSFPADGVEVVGGGRVMPVDDPDFGRKFVLQSGDKNFKLSWPEASRLLGNGESGSGIYSTLSRVLGSEAKASAKLKELGIPGIRFLDQGSRPMAKKWTKEYLGDGWTAKDTSGNVRRFDSEKAADEYIAKHDDPVTRNLVIFDDSLIDIAPGDATPALKDVRPPKENLQTVVDSLSNSASVTGEKMVPIEKLIGGVTEETGDLKKVKELTQQMKGDGAYIERLIVDDAGNVIEGQHRLEALRRLGVKQVPVVEVEDYMRDFPEGVSKAVAGAGKIHPDHVNQLTGHLAEIYKKEGGNIKEVMKYAPPEGYRDAWYAGINALKKQAKKTAADPEFNFPTGRFQPFPYPETGDNSLVRTIAHGIKNNDDEAITAAARHMGKGLPKNAVLIPMPNHDGAATTTKKLADRIQELSSRGFVRDVLTGTKRGSQYDLKKQGSAPLSGDQFGFKANDLPNKERFDKEAPVFIVDSVIGTGNSMRAAQAAFKQKYGIDAQPLVFTVDKRASGKKK